MTDMEDGLRRALNDQPSATSTDEILARVDAAAGRHRHMRVGAAAAAVALVIAGGATAAALQARGHHLGPTRQQAVGQPDAVVWVNTPGTRPSPPAPTSPAPRTAAYAQCRADQLTAALGPIGGGTGTLTQYVTVTNSSSSECTLSGAPGSVTGTRRNGEPASVDPHPVPASDAMLSSPANLAPGQSGEFALLSSDMCPSAANPEANAIQSLRFQVEAGSTMTVAIPTDEPLQLSCDLSFSTFGEPQQAPDPVVEKPLHALTVTSAMPDRVTAGSTVTYQVTLTNPTGSDIALEPCPAYTEFLTPANTSPAAYSQTYELNCSGAGDKIPANSSVTFDMQILAPGEAGEAKFGWSIPGAGVTTGRALTITSP